MDCAPALPSQDRGLIRITPTPAPSRMRDSYTGDVVDERSNIFILHSVSTIPQFTAP